MSKYSDSKVYLIYLPDLEEFGYVGSTTQSLNDRLKEHRYSAKSDVKYKFASAVLWECEDSEPLIKCLEEVCCDTKQELLERERYWLDQFPDAVNKHDPVISEEERHERRKATLLKCYYAKRDERIEKNRAYKEAHKEEIATQRASPEHREKEKVAQKARYDAGYKAKRSEAKKVKVACAVCGKEMNKNSLWEHTKKLHPLAE